MEHKEKRIIRGSVRELRNLFERPADPGLYIPYLERSG
jgi:hypothetical protein